MTYKESTRAREMDHRISFWTYKRWVKFSRFDRKQKMPKWRPSNTTRKCRFFSLISFLSISSTFNWCDMSKRLMRHFSSVHQWQVKLFRKVKRKKVQFDRQQKTKTLAALHQTKRWIYWWKKRQQRLANEKKMKRSFGSCNCTALGNIHGWTVEPNWRTIALLLLLFCHLFNLLFCSLRFIFLFVIFALWNWIIAMRPFRTRPTNRTTKGTGRNCR